MICTSICYDASAGVRDTRSERADSRFGNGWLIWCSSRAGRALVFLILAGPVLLAACESLPDRSSFRQGMTKQELLAEFGEPVLSRTMVKRGEAVWGPIERFWSKLEPGAEVEIWSYRVKGGMVELYFINGSDTVGEFGFTPEGVVY